MTGSETMEESKSSSIVMFLLISDHITARQALKWPDFI